MTTDEMFQQMHLELFTYLKKKRRDFFERFCSKPGSQPLGPESANT